jgi:hypothetical protein
VIKVSYELKASSEFFVPEKEREEAFLFLKHLTKTQACQSCQGYSVQYLILGISYMRVIMRQALEGEDLRLGTET